MRTDSSWNMFRNGKAFEHRVLIYIKKGVSSRAYG